jgi:mono/diheme cytochrome c family protein
MIGGRTLVVAALTVFASVACAHESGEMLYSMYCSPCHGDGLVNTTNQAFDLRRFTAKDRARFVSSVLTGKNQMPPWKDVLDHDQIERLWQYVRENAFQK